MIVNSYKIHFIQTIINKTASTILGFIQRQYKMEFMLLGDWMENNLHLY